nr:solute carrier family 17 member 9 isoform X3 [Hydra vulgaris]XP_047124294.1 solute carrier family 17 member 9 isoform X4 [Hydra vulgaris]
MSRGDFGTPIVKYGSTSATFYRSQRSPLNEKFDKLEDNISSKIFQINKNLSSLESISKKIEESNDEAVEQKIHVISKETNQLANDIRDLFKEISELFQRNQPVHQNNFQRNQPVHQVNLSINQNKLKNEFESSLTRYQKIQNVIASKMKANIQKEMIPEATYDETDEITLVSYESDQEKPCVLSYDTKNLNDQTERTQLVMHDLEELKEKESRLNQIEEDILNVNEIFRDMALLVHEQGSTIDSIESNIEHAVIQVEQANSELIRATKYQGMVMSAFFFGYILTQILSGVFSDRFGGERVLFLSATIWSISTFLIPFVKNILPVNVGFIALRIITGVAQGFYFPALTSLVSKNIHPNNRNFAYSFAASGTSMGSIFSGLIGSLLLDYSGWRSVFLFIGSLCMMWVFMLKIFIQQDFNYDNIIVVNQNAVSFNWKSLKTSKPFWTLLFCSTCESLVFTLLLSWVPTYFHDEFPQSKGWLFNVIPWVASFFIENICGILSDEMLKKGYTRTMVRKLLVSAAFFPPVVFCFILNHVTSFEMGLFLMTLIIGGMGANSSGIGMNPQDLAPNHAGLIYGVANTLGAISGMVGVYITGRILDATDEWALVFQLVSIVSLLGGLSFLFFGTGEKIV